MLEPGKLRTSALPKWFDASKLRIDPARKADLARTRGARAARLLGRTTPYDLKIPWLTLRADQPIVPDKGWLEFTSPSFIGMGNFDEGQRMFAAFDLIFQKDEPGSHSIERPQVAIRIPDPPKAKLLVEMDIHAHDNPPGDPKFEIWAANNQTMTVTDGVRTEIMFVMNDFAAIQSAWAEGKNFFDRDGNWAFFEARITPLD